MLVADVGAREFAILEGRGQEGQRFTFIVDSLAPLRVRRASKPEGTFWGYEIRRAPTLARFIRSVSFDTIIFTSRLGNPINKHWVEFCERCKPSAKTLVCFGSPDSGINELLKQDEAKVSDFRAMYLNMFPAQNTDTIRLEEALFGTLSILNVATRMNVDLSGGT
jgi:predicted SPOUT superfamily RNA methylase MTH1